MLSLNNISLRAGNNSEAKVLLDQVSFSVNEGEFVAVIGTSGSGKSTLLKLVAGIYEQHLGDIFWQGRNLVHDEDMSPSDVGYIPQFSIAYDYLTVWENIESAMQLRVKGLNREKRSQRIERILKETGLASIQDRLARLLSGGEKRRLALAMELVGNPVLLLSDEVTSGLDPTSEDDIVNLLHRLSRSDKRIVMSVTHSLDHIHLYDRVLVMHAGQLVYNGRPEELAAHFGVEHPDELYRNIGDVAPLIDSSIEEPPPAKEEVVVQALPNRFEQAGLLLHRRLKIFFRDRSQFLLQLGLIVGFPAVIVLFAMDGLPQIKSLNMGYDTGLIEQLVEANSFMIESTKAGALVSGLVMFQVVLLTLMGANNAAREITAERLILEKEKLAGLHVSSYLISKILFISILVLLQSVWMTLFVKGICRFPGPLGTQLALLIGVNGAITFLSLAVSSLMKTSEQASLVTIYFVGFQLPLSGAVLALPEWLSFFIRPFIAAYWGWSGYIMTLKDTRLYDVVKMVSQTTISADFLCLWVMGSHMVLGLILAYAGCRQSRWKHL